MSSPADAGQHRLAPLLAEVGAFYITDRAMKKAQDAAEKALAAGTLDARAEATYIAAVSAYFTGFEREAQAQLKHVDRELAKLYQLQYNLNAERGVAARRVEATQGVLAHVRELGGA